LQLFVAPDGSDKNNGTSPSSPLATPQAALARAQIVRRPLPAGGIEINFRAGLYFVENIVELTWRDGGDGPDAPLVLQTYPPDLKQGHRAVLSGGMRIEGFKLDASHPGRWWASIPPGTAPFSQLFTTGLGNGQGQRRQRARIPNAQPADPTGRGMGDESTFQWDMPLAPCAQGTCPDEDKLGFVFGAGQLNSSWAWGRAQVLVFHAWTAWWSDVKTVVQSNNTLLFQEASRTPVGQFAKQGGQRYFIENVLEGLDEAGEWYWDPSASVLTLIPAPGDELASFAPVAAQVPTILRIRGSSHVRIRDMGFAHAAAGVFSAPSVYSPPQAAVEASNATDLAIEGCSVTHCGASGVKFFLNGLPSFFLLYFC